MKIMIIHNSQDKVRLENILKQFASQNTKHNYDIIEAIWNPAQFCAGVSRSFKKCIEIAKKEGHSEILIFEDDFLTLHPDAIDKLIALSSEYPLSDGILLGSVYEGTPQILGEGLAQIKDKFSALNSVIIPESLYEVILRAEENYHLDYWLGQIAKIPIYVAYPFLICQLDSYSSNTKAVTNYNTGLKLKYKLISYENL